MKNNYEMNQSVWCLAQHHYWPIITPAIIKEITENVNGFFIYELKVSGFTYHLGYHENAVFPTFQEAKEKLVKYVNSLEEPKK